jgi:hypothetical protein
VSGPSRQRAAFSEYLKLGPSRSLVKLQAVLRADPGSYGFPRAPSIRTLESWSTQYGWLDEIASLERQSAQEERREHIQEIKDYRSRLRKEGLLLQRKGIDWLARKDADEVRTHEAIRAIAEGFRLEALGLGDVTEGVEVKEDYGDFARRLTDDELDRLVAALRAAAVPAAD